MRRASLNVSLVLGLCLAGCNARESPPGANPFGFSAEPTGNVLRGMITCNGQPVLRGNVLLLNTDKRPVGLGKIQPDGTYLVNNVTRGQVFLIITTDEMDPQLVKILLGRAMQGPGPRPGRGGPVGPPGMGGPPGPAGVGGPARIPLLGKGKGITLPKEPNEDLEKPKPVGFTDKQMEMMKGIDQKYSKSPAFDLTTNLVQGDNVYDLTLTVP